MKLAEVLGELAKCSVPDTVVLRIVDAFRAEGMVRRRREYAREWQKTKRKASEAA